MRESIFLLVLLAPDLKDKPTCAPELGLFCHTAFQLPLGILNCGYCYLHHTSTQGRAYSFLKVRPRGGHKSPTLVLLEQLRLDNALFGGL